MKQLFSTLFAYALVCLAVCTLYVLLYDNNNNNNNKVRRCVVGAVCQVMARGIFAFYAAYMPNTLNTIKSYSATFRMPFVTSGMAVNSSRQEVAYELYVRPQYSRALRDIIVEYKWTEIWYIYSSSDGLPHKFFICSIVSSHVFPTVEFLNTAKKRHLLWPV